jgi:hypothetical protein
MARFAYSPARTLERRMDERDEIGEEPATMADIGEHVRTWRMFLAKLRWAVVTVVILLLLLLVFRTHG